MRGNGIERTMRWVAGAGLALAATAVTGVGMARWAVAEASGFYLHPIDRGPPAYARARPVADRFWDRQAADDGYATAAGSTATSTQPAYFSASGS